MRASHDEEVVERRTKRSWRMKKDTCVRERKEKEERRTFLVTRDVDVDGQNGEKGQENWNCDQCVLERQMHGSKVQNLVPSLVRSFPSSPFYHFILSACSTT